MREKLRIRAISGVFLSIFLTYTTKGDINLFIFRHRSQGVTCSSIWLCFGKGGKVITYVLTYSHKAINPV
jgi:hypothetical protein